MVDVDVASRYPTPVKTINEILCDFFTKSAATQEHFLDHIAIVELESSLSRQQNWTVKTHTNIKRTLRLSRPGYFSSEPAMRSLKHKLEKNFDARIQEG